MTAVTYTATKGLKLLGDEKGAWMADTTAETLTGTELVVDGNMSVTTNWTAVNVALAITGGFLRVTSTSAFGRAYQDITTVVGDTYVVAAKAYSDSGNTTMSSMVMAYSSGAELVRVTSTGTTSEQLQMTFVADSTTTQIRLYINSAVIGDIAYFDVVSVRPAVADLSAADNSLQVYGDIVKSAVNTGAELIGYSGFSRGADLAVDGDFANACGVDWTCGTGWTISGGKATHAAGVQGNLTQIITLNEGKDYVVTLTTSSATAGNFNVYFGGNLISENPAANKVWTFFASAGAIDEFTFVGGSTWDGSVTSVSIREVSAIIQPENSDLDVGTGDVCYMMWAKLTGAGYILYRAEFSDTAPLIDIYYNGADIRYRVGVTGNINDGIDVSGWTFICLVRDSGVCKVYRDGSLAVTASRASTLTNTDAKLFIGGTPEGYSGTAGSEKEISMVRALAYAPTAAQIKSIYESEKHLFNKYSTYTQVGESYSLDFDSVSTLTRAPMTQGTARVAIDGTREYLKKRDEVLWDVTTGIVDRDLFDPTRRFLESVSGGAQFTFDPYGTTSAPYETRICTLESNSHAEHVTGARLLSASFKVRES